MNFTLNVWRQKNADTRGGMVAYQVHDIGPTLSFLEMLDVLNEQLIERGDEPIAFDSDCREGICGTCSLMIDGVAHGPQEGTTACQLSMRHFKDGQVITVEPWRAKPFQTVRDLVVDRGSFDRIIEAGGFVSIGTGSAPDANVVPVPKDDADVAFQAATCIGCGACVAACPNGSAMLFVAAKAAHLSRLPQGHPERTRRTIRMVEQMDLEGFGGCTNHYECADACPKGIPVRFIAELNHEFLKAALTSREFETISPPVEAEENRGATPEEEFMDKGRHIRCFDYVNHPYEKVRDALKGNALPVFVKATSGASARADAVASQLKVSVGALEVGTDIEIVVHKVEETPGAGKKAPGMRVLFEWKARESSRLFPLMHASLDFYPLTADETQLDFSGHYDPPLGVVGTALDAMVGKRVAEASIHTFVTEVAEYLRRTIT